MTWPTPTRKDHETFCRGEGWRVVRDARGRGTHHLTYEFDLPNRHILRTRISHPVDRTDYGKRIWGHILRDQLQVDEPVFWACVQDGVKPDRGLPKQPVDTLPADVVHLLITRLGLAEADVATMSREEAIARLRDFWLGTQGD